MTPEQIKELLADDAFMDGMSDRVLAKADTIAQATGLLWYDLSPIVQMLYPFRQLIPLISKLPRSPGDGGNAYHWKRITAINVGNIEAGVSEGNRGGVISIQLDDQVAAYKALGFESSVSFEARLGAKNLNPDAIGNAVQATLRSLMIAEEKLLLLGNASNALGTTPRPAALTDVGSGGSIASGTVVSVICVALTGQGWLNSSVTGGIKQGITRTNADGSSDTFGGGSAAKSQNRSATAGSNNDSFTTSVTAVLGAVAYAWFWGTVGNETLGAITFTNQLTVTVAVGTGTQLASSLDSNDHSTNALVPDGLLSIIYGEIFGQPPSLAMSTNPGNLPSDGQGNTVQISKSGALYVQMSGTQILTSGSHPAIDQFDAILQAAYEQYKVGYDRMLVNVQQVIDISDILLSGAGSNATAYRINFTADNSGQIKAGFRVTSYLNKFMGNDLPIEVHPFVPPGTIIFWSDKIPYELPGVPNILEAHVRQDYYEIQWPLKRRAYEYGVYTDEVFVCYFAPAFAAIFNVKAGH